MARARKTISTNTTTWLGGAYSADSISSKILQLTASASWNGSVTVVRRLPAFVDPAVGGAPVAPAACTVIYHDETTGTDQSTAITGTTLNKIVSVRADRSEIGLVTTGTTVGALVVDYDAAQG
jgi:hypothetical protein